MYAGEYFFYASYWSDDWSSFWSGRYDSSSGGRWGLEKGYDVSFAFFSNLSRCSGRYRHFYPLGIPVWPLLAVRFITAVFLTIAVSFVWNKVEKKKRRNTIVEEY